MKFFIRYFYAPVFFIGFIGIAVWLIDMQIDGFWLIFLLVSAIFINLLFEQILPFEKTWNYSKADIKRDIVHAVVNESSIVFSLSLIPLISTYNPIVTVWPNEWHIVYQLIFALLIADFGITLVHYLSHRINLLWRFHSIHHSVERMYGFNGLMKHPLHQTIELVAGTIPLILMGMPYEVGVLLAFSVAVQLLLQHSNVDMRLGNILYIWAVAPGHRHHHIASSKFGDVNFGLFTMIWDHLLGTFVLNRPQPRDGEIGIGGRLDFPKDYIGQLIEPFKSKLD